MTKIPTATFAGATPLTPASRLNGTGIPFETVRSMQGVQRLELLDAMHSVVIQGRGSPLDLRAIELP